MTKRILVTGASGFIGSFIASEGLKQGYEVWAGMRSTSSKRYLQDDGLRFAELDLAQPAVLRRQLATLKEAMDGHGWDYVVHAAGATKSRDREGFFRTNKQGTINLVEALIAEGMTPERFVFISSLSVYGAVREQPVRKATKDNPWIYSPILTTDTPQPNTAYGESKLEAERYLATLKGFPYVILRPSGVYGPREKDYFMMAQCIKQHTDFAVGYKPQEITFVYVADVVQAVYKACKAGDEVIGKGYFLTDGEVYNSRRFSDLLQKEMGDPWVLHIKAPLWFLRMVCAVNGTVARWMHKLTTLNQDKYNILSQRNWQCDIETTRRDLGYEPKVKLEEGVKETVAWYKREGWL